MNNKKVIGLLLGGVIFFGGAPYLLGNMARDNLEQQAVRISEIPGYKAKVISYDQGWFSSRAVLSYGFDEHTLTAMRDSTGEQTPEGQEVFSLLETGLSFDIEIAHGPVSFQNGIKFALMTLEGKLNDIDHEAFATFKEKADVDSLMHLAAQVSYAGNSTITVNSPGFKVDYPTASGQIMAIDYAGMDIKATIPAQMDHYDASFQINQFSIESTTVNLALGKITGIAKGQKINEHLWLGSGTTSFSEMTIKGPTGSFNLTDLNSDYALEQESDEALMFNGIFTAKEFTAPDLSVTDFTLDFTASHLDLAAITDYVKSIQELYNTEGETQPTAQEVAAKTQIIVARVGEQLIKGSPEVLVKKLGFHMGDGFLKGTSSLNINGENLDSIQQLSTPLELNKRLLVETNITFDKPLAVAIMTLTMKQQMAAAGMDISAMPPAQLQQTVMVQTSTMLQQLVNQGYFVQDGENFMTHFEMKDGQRLINGKPLALPGL